MSMVVSLRRVVNGRFGVLMCSIPSGTICLLVSLETIVPKRSLEDMPLMVSSRRVVPRGFGALMH
jgi:hypothetical protein